MDEDQTYFKMSSNRSVNGKPVSEYNLSMKCSDKDKHCVLKVNNNGKKKTKKYSRRELLEQMRSDKMPYIFHDQTPRNIRRLIQPKKPIILETLTEVDSPTDSDNSSETEVLSNMSNASQTPSELPVLKMNMSDLKKVIHQLQGELPPPVEATPQQVSNLKQLESSSQMKMNLNKVPVIE